jgi:fucose permease
LKRKPRYLLVAIAYLSFVGLGLPGAMLGVAWPSMQVTFALPLDGVGAFLIAETIGYLLTSSYSGPLISRIGVGKLLLASAILRMTGLLGIGLAPAWWLVVLLGIANGMGGGVLDSGLNTYFATNHGANLMNWLHANFGIGATLGPIVMQTALNVGESWRWGYVAVGLLHGLFAIGFGLTRDRWTLAGSPDPETDAQGQGMRRVRGMDTLKLPLVWVGVVLFFLFTGVENTTGQWTYSLLAEARSVAPEIAAFWVSVYWGSLTVGRIVFGFVAERLGIERSLRLVMLGAMVAAALIWWNGFGLFGFPALALMGFAVAPLFPLSVSATPKRVGAEHAANAIGYQLASGSLGFALLPALAGTLAKRVGLEIVGPFLLVTAAVMFVLHEVIARRRV